MTHEAHGTLVTYNIVTQEAQLTHEAHMAHKSHITL